MNGVLLINKPGGVISHDVVKFMRWSLRGSKVGHIGTLDPAARGLLPLMIGSANRLHRYFNDSVKAYRGTIFVGQSTDTLDAEGSPTSDFKEVKLDEGEVERVFSQFRGKVKQVPPLYSAVKINGKPLYKYARNGEMVDVVPREVEIYSLDITEIEANLVRFEVRCSSGTYIRTLADDFGKEIGYGAHLAELERLTVNGFHLQSSIDFDRLKNGETERLCRENLLPLSKLLLDFDCFFLEDRESSFSFVSGQVVSVEKGELKKSSRQKDDLYYNNRGAEDFVRVFFESYFLGMGKMQGSVIQPRTVLAVREDFI